MRKVGPYQIPASVVGAGRAPCRTTLAIRVQGWESSLGQDRVQRTAILGHRGAKMGDGRGSTPAQEDPRSCRWPADQNGLV